MCIAKCFEFLGYSTFYTPLECYMLGSRFGFPREILQGNFYQLDI
jgi:hypothetical protein